MLHQTALRLTLISALAAMASACTTLPSFSAPEYVSALDGASVQENRTRYSQALECLRPMVGMRNSTAKRYAVGRVNDFSGKEDLTNGKRITQGAALMVISALAKTGVPIVERFDTSIADMELKYSDNKLISDNPENKEYRRIFSGSLPGSDYHIMGGITEVNYNIRSGSLESSIRFIGAAARYFVMNVAVDLRLVDTKTLEIINTQSLQKQIIGTELNGGYFRLFTDGLVDINGAERTQEPIQKGVRMVIEQAVFNMVSQVNNISPSQCAQLVNAKSADENQQRTAANTSNPVANTPNTNITTATSSKKSNVVADPFTGEIVPLANSNSAPNTASTAQPPSSDNPNREIPSLKGLFGGSSTAASTPGETPAAPVNRDMQEKLLYGNRPQLR